MVIQMTNRKSYSELMQLETFEERFNYLKLEGRVGEETFGYDRILNQMLYQSARYKRVRDKVVIRDNGYDLGVEGREIQGRIIVHHINPITVEQVINLDECVFDPENLISTSHLTHNAIHYSDENILIKDPIERRRNDTCPWKR